LVGSFIYILIFLLLLAYSRWEIFQLNEIDPFWLQKPRSQLVLGLLLTLTLAVTVVPLLFSRKKLKRLEILSNL
jgi:hypothetical protein